MVKTLTLLLAGAATMLGATLGPILIGYGWTIALAVLGLVVLILWPTKKPRAQSNPETRELSLVGMTRERIDELEASAQRRATWVDEVQELPADQLEALLKAAQKSRPQGEQLRRSSTL